LLTEKWIEGDSRGHLDGVSPKVYDAQKLTRGHQDAYYVSKLVPHQALNLTAKPTTLWGNGSCFIMLQNLADRLLRIVCLPADGSDMLMREWKICSSQR